MFDYTQAGRMVSHPNLGVSDSKPSCERPTILRTTRSLEVMTLRVFTCFKEESSLKIKIVMSGNVYDKVMLLFVLLLHYILEVIQHTVGT